MESYQDTLQYLYQLQYSGIKLGLKNVKLLLKYSGDPQKKWPAIHIAGTNGKGSTAAFLYSALREAGYRVGLYTSPHLVDFAERIQINGQRITWERIVAYTRQLKPQIEKHQATFFEATTALAFQYFADEMVDIAIIETGLGGRLDATNLVRPALTLITTVSMDHQQYLGNTPAQIAHEKAGIIKEGIPCFTNNTLPEILNILQTTCSTRKSPLVVIDPARDVTVVRETLLGSTFHFNFYDQPVKNLTIALAGFHQIGNAALAAAALLHPGKYSISPALLHRGLQKAEWPGRLQIFQQQPLTLLDVAHNPDGFEKIFHSLQRILPDREKWAIVGISRDKDAMEISKILSQNVSRIGLVSGFSERELDSATLARYFSGAPVRVDTYPDVAAAYQQFRSSLPTDGVILVMGSHFLVGDFLKKIQLS